LQDQSFGGGGRLMKMPLLALSAGRSCYLLE
jgi:hypothetical protein